MASLDAVTEPDCRDLAKRETGPSVHGHRIGVIEEAAIRGRVGTDIRTEVEHEGNGPLGVEEAPGSEGVADTLVDAIAEGNFNVMLEGLQSPDTNGVDDIVRAFEGLGAVGRALDPDGNAIGIEIALTLLPDLFEDGGIDVHEGDFKGPESGHAHQVEKELAGKSQASGPDKADFKGCPGKG